MNYIEIFEKENECHTRLKEVQALSRRLRGQLYWQQLFNINYMGGMI